MIELIIISGLIGLAFQSFIEPEMIFGFYGIWLKKMGRTPLGKKLAKPLGGCIICNTTWIGIIVALLQRDPEYAAGGLMLIVKAIIIGVAASGVAIILNTCMIFIKEKMD
jgi:hypothetical protein